MLRASYTYLSKGVRGGGTHITEREVSCEVEELLELIDRFCEMSSDLDGRFPPGVSGCHAHMSIVDQGFVLHAYFEGEKISFELYGPVPVGKELELEYSNPYDGSGLGGELHTETLKGVLRRLDRVRSPREYLKKKARKCLVIAD